MAAHTADAKHVLREVRLMRLLGAHDNVLVLHRISDRREKGMLTTTAVAAAEEEAQAARAWRKELGFNPDDAREMATMLFGLEQTPALVTPMIYACYLGDLEMCQFHFTHGAAKDIRTVANGGCTPMYVACEKGHLSVCEWLFKMGATEDIRIATNRGTTPLRIAWKNEHPSVQHWLILKGALKPTPDGHTDPDTITRDIPQQSIRTALLQWAMEQVAANAEFQRTVLPGTLAAPRKASEHLWKLGSLDEETSAHLKGLVADFAGVAHGRGLRNVREAAEALTAMMDN